MKTTIEISDDLLKRSRSAAKREGTTLRNVVEDGLRLALHERKQRPAKTITLPIYGGSGMTDEFHDADWERIRAASYRGHGA